MILDEQLIISYLNLKLSQYYKYFSEFSHSEEFSQAASFNYTTVRVNLSGTNLYIWLKIIIKRKKEHDVIANFLHLDHPCFKF